MSNIIGYNSTTYLKTPLTSIYTTKTSAQTIKQKSSSILTPNNNTTHKKYYVPEQKIPTYNDSNELSKTDLMKAEKMEKLKYLQSMKHQKIDKLNLKIKKMINTLSFQQSPIHSFIKQSEFQQKCKNDYSSSKIINNQSNENLFETKIKENSTSSKQLIQSTVIPMILSSLDQDIIKAKNINKPQLSAIKMKYKDSKQLSKCQSNSSFNSHKENMQSSHRLNADLIRLRQQIKSTHQTHCRTLSHEASFTTNFKFEKQNFGNQSYCAGYNQISQQAYHKTFESCNQKRQILVQCHKKQQSPLHDVTNNYYSYKSRQTKQVDTIKQSQAKFFLDALKEEEESEPPTADFRIPQEPNYLHNFLTSLINQIKLDEQFRKAKIWLKKIHSNNKWIDLSSHLQRKDVFLDQSSILEIFSLQQEEDNPFYSARKSDFTISSLAQTFIKCQEHWFSNIIKNFKREKLQRSGFKQQRIDFSHKGYLEIQDLTRFLNFQMDLHFRNRDLYLIFLRLKSQEKLTYTDIIEVICQ